MASAALPVGLPGPYHACLLPGAGRRHTITLCRAGGKGFGSGLKPRKEDDDEGGVVAKGRVKRIRQRQEPTPFQEQRTPGGALANVQIRRVEELEEQMRGEAEDDEFMKRLEVIKLEGREKARELPRIPNGSKPGAPQGAVFDGSAAASRDEDIYANPPSLGDTLLNQMNSEISDPALRSAKIGPGQLGLALGALALGLIIVLVSGADYSGASKRFKGVRPKSPAPEGIEAKLLASRAATLAARLEERPDDLEALEALAVTQAKLYNFPEAIKLLDKLTAARPGDVEAWRLLGEASLLSAQSGKSVAAYEKAIALRENDLQILTGLTDAYIANSQPKKAADYLLGLRERLAAQRTSQAATSSTAATSISSSTNNSPEAAATVSTASSDNASGDSSSTTTASDSSQTDSNSDIATAPSIASAEVTGTLQAPALADSGSSNTAEAAGAGATTSSPDTSSPGTGSTATSTSSSKDASGSRQPAAAEAQPQPQVRPVDPVAVDLLLGKTYAAWRGHDIDAIAAYDHLIKAYPEDFRGYLAKGVFLKEKGRKGDAERMFIQAKFYAPTPSLRAFVAQKAGENPTLEMPDNGLE